MHKHYIGITILGILVLIVCIIGFSIVGSPVSQKGIRLDETRIGDFSTIKSAVEAYYSTNKQLPDSITDLSFIYSPEPKDPESKEGYIYEKSTDSEYRLCATFSTDSEEIKEKNQNDRSYYYDLPGENKHKKGYDCIVYQIPSYLLPTPTYAPSNMEIFQLDPTAIPTPSQAINSAQ